MSKSLIDNPLIVVPALAVEIGLNEALVLQQIQFWLHYSKLTNEGRKWINKTYEDLQKRFPFWSLSTIKQTLSSLENRGLLISENCNQSLLDNKRYTIEYEKIAAFTQASWEDYY